MNCYACGQRVSPETSFSDISTHDEVYSILATGSKLHRRLNELRAATRVFPPEILSKIFCHASPPTDFAAFDFVEPDETDYAPESHGQITLGTVSSHWRQVVLATPQLWTSAIINVTPRSAERKAQLIQLYLTNVGHMTISLHITPDSEELKRSDFDPIFNSIWKGAHKFKLISLCHFPGDWILLPEDRFTHLEDLRLKRVLNTRHPGPDPPKFQITSFPRLRHLYVCFPTIRFRSPPLCQSLTTLHLVDVYLHICIKMLLLCPNLIEYACHKSRWAVDDIIPQISHPITFSHMKVFCSPCSNTAFFSSILCDLNFPVLEVLGLELKIDENGLEDLISFMPRLPTTWSILEISSCQCSYAVLKRILQCVPPQVRSLHLPNIRYIDLKEILELLKEFDDNNKPYMVGLLNICLNHSSYWFRSMEEPTGSLFFLHDVFLNMVSTRKHCLTDGQFSLEIESNEEGYWEYFRGRLKQMDADGFRLKITMLGKTVTPPPDS